MLSAEIIFILPHMIQRRTFKTCFLMTKREQQYLLIVLGLFLLGLGVRLYGVDHGVSFAGESYRGEMIYE